MSVTPPAPAVRFLRLLRFARSVRLVRVGVLAPLLLAAAMLTGCGGGSGNGDADPASVAPKASSVYAVATVSPEGDQRDALQGVARKLSGEADPGKALTQALQRAINRSGSAGKLDLQHDVKPWLGKRAAIAISQFQPGGRRVGGAVIVASKDLDATRRAIKKLEQGQRVAHASHRGVDYDVDRSDQSSIGIVEDFLVVGFRPEAFRAVVDAAKDGGLGDAQSFQDAKRRGAGKLALAYVDIKGLTGAALQLLPPDQRAAVEGTLGGANAQPLTATLDAKSNAVNLELLAPAGNGARSAGPGDAPVIAGLPGDSFAALGIRRVGQTLSTALRNFETGLAGAVINPLKRDLTRATGLDAQRDILAALGDIGLFARGNSLLTLGGGAVVQSPNPAAARRLVTKLGAFIARQGAARGVKATATRVGGAAGVKVTLPRVPGAINLVLKGARLVLAYGDAATVQALSPSTKLSESDMYKRAAESLGGISPSLFVSFPPLVPLVTAAASGRSNANIGRAEQVLRSLDTLAVGGRVEGRQRLIRLVLRLT